MSDSTIKAIETSYAGCRFRSRLEARWAVFFDTLGIAARSARFEHGQSGSTSSSVTRAQLYWCPDCGEQGYDFKQISEDLYLHLTCGSYVMPAWVEG